MSWRDIFAINKNDASSNNYKLALFNQVNDSSEIASMSTIKQYFNNLYNINNVFSSFSVGQTLHNAYISEDHDKITRLQQYRNIAADHQLGKPIDMMCYSANIPDENNELIHIQITDQYLDAKDIQRIKDCIQEYLNLFDFENNFEEYFRTFIIEGQICWENIVAKDDIEQGIIGINIIPNDAYEFCYDTLTRQKIGIMIRNTLADNFYISDVIGCRSINGATCSIAGHYNNLNCYDELLENKCIVLPWDQLTYVDSGRYSDDSKVVYSILERAKRPFNQLKLMEDAILIYRLARSPEKYVFNVDIGKMSARAGEQKVSQLKKQFGTKKVYDPVTSSVGKAYDPMQMMESFWFVKGSDSAGISVSPLQSSHNFGNLDDLDYFRKNLLTSLNIPISRFYASDQTIVNGNGDGSITADELNFAKFIMSQQRRFSAGLLNGAIIHLKLTGLWEVYKLTRDKIKIIINPPTEYEAFRRQKQLENKVSMMKTLLGEETVSKLFSTEIALELFMGWDKAKIERNNQRKFNEAIKAAKLEYYTEKIKESGTIDVKNDEEALTFKEVLQQGLNTSFLSSPNKPETENSEESVDEEDEFSTEEGGGDEE